MGICCGKATKPKQCAEAVPELNQELLQCNGHEAAVRFRLAVCMELLGQSVNLILVFGAKPTLGRLMRCVEDVFSAEMQALGGMAHHVCINGLFVDNGPHRPWARLCDPDNLHEGSQLFSVLGRCVSRVSPCPRLPTGAAAHIVHHPISAMEQFDALPVNERPNISKEQRLRQVFEEMDVGRKGFLNLTDFQCGFCRLGFSDDVAEKIFRDGCFDDGDVYPEDWKYLAGIYPNTFDMLYFKGGPSPGEAQTQVPSFRSAAAEAATRTIALDADEMWLVEAEVRAVRASEAFRNYLQALDTARKEFDEAAKARGSSRRARDSMNSSGAGAETTLKQTFEQLDVGRKGLLDFADFGRGFGRLGLSDIVIGELFFQATEGKNDNCVLFSDWESLYFYFPNTIDTLYHKRGTGSAGGAVRPAVAPSAEEAALVEAELRKYRSFFVSSYTDRYFKGAQEGFSYSAAARGSSRRARDRFGG